MTSDCIKPWTEVSVSGRSQERPGVGLGSHGFAGPLHSIQVESQLHVQDTLTSLLARVLF